MRRMKLERRLLCAESGRIADINMAAGIMREVAALPLEECFAEEQQLSEYVRKGLGMDDDPFYPCEYGDACLKLVYDVEAGMAVSESLIMVFAYMYGKRGMEDG